MGIFKFTSPEGVDYYGEGADAYEAFKTATEKSSNDLAAMRTRQSVKPSGGRGESDFTGTLEDTLVPGLGAVKAGMRGDWEGAAGQAAIAALPYGSRFVPSAAKAAGVGGAAFFGPDAHAESMFAAEPDPAKRKALEKQYNQATPKGQREILGQFNTQQGKIQEEKRAFEREENARRGTEQRRKDWDTENSEAIKSLRPEWQNQIRAAGSLPEAQEMFSRGMLERQKAGMTIAEQYPLAVGGLEAAGMLGGAILPGKLAAGRSSAIKEATSDAERAFRAAWGPGTRSSKGRTAEAELAENILKQVHGMGQFSATEMAGGVAAPWIMGQMPNFYDMVIGQLSSDPGAQEKVQRAWDNVLSLGPLERSLIEGGAATGLGTWLGSGRRDFSATKARSQGVLDTFEARRAAAEAAAAKRAASRSRPAPAPAPQQNLSAALQATMPSTALGTGVLGPAGPNVLKKPSGTP